jgi:FAD/FMN-containing dehydrogenase
MNKIKGFDESYGIITAQSGAILEDMDNYLSDRGYAMPLDLGAKGSCQIGGNLSTNAGGIHFIKHNSLHANCIGLKVVLPSGEILDNITTLRKDNTGYDLKHLFIGAEGTLGVITDCAILCPTRPKQKQLVLLACNSFEDVLSVLKKAKNSLSDILQAFEFMDRESMQFVSSYRKTAPLFA